mmetsp:Transcript_5149/g.12107  ORF Transcript_5149/g.12107 Transcript_5149/m.12107 type:complete len:348 (-) Transcript_5149:1611-2654(-)
MGQLDELVLDPWDVGLTIVLLPRRVLAIVLPLVVAELVVGHPQEARALLVQHCELLGSGQRNLQRTDELLESAIFFCVFLQMISMQFGNLADLTLSKQFGFEKRRCLTLLTRNLRSVSRPLGIGLFLVVLERCVLNTEVTVQFCHVDVRLHGTNRPLGCGTAHHCGKRGVLLAEHSVPDIQRSVRHLRNPGNKVAGKSADSAALVPLAGNNFDGSSANRRLSLVAVFVPNHHQRLGTRRVHFQGSHITSLSNVLAFLAHHLTQWNVHAVMRALVLGQRPHPHAVNVLLPFDNDRIRRKRSGARHVLLEQPLVGQFFIHKHRRQSIEQTGVHAPEHFQNLPLHHISHL